MRSDRRPDAISQIQRELHDERAAALRRIAGHLEGLLARLHDLRRELQSLPASERRTHLLDVYRDTRKDVLRYRWYLEVQREANGLTRHSMLDDVYAVPGPIAE